MPRARVQLIGPALSAAAVCALLSYGCKKAEPTPAPVRSASAEPAHAAPAPVVKPTETPAKPAATPPPATPPAAAPSEAGKPVTPDAQPAAGTAAVETKPDAEAQPPKRPPIPHEEIAQDAKPLTTFNTPTGVVVEEFKVGEGTAVLPGAAGASVTFHFIARLKNGWKTIQDTYHDGEPMTATGPQLLPGVADGMMGMRPGGVRRLTIPASRAFKNREPKNEKGEVVIPAGSTLVYDLELVSVKQSYKPPEPPAEPGAAPAPAGEMNK